MFSEIDFASFSSALIRESCRSSLVASRMDTLIVLFVSVMITFSLVTLVLQALTMRSVRSLSRDSRVDLANSRDFSIPSPSPEPGARSSTDLKSSTSQLPAIKEKYTVPSTIMQRLPASHPQWQWLSYTKFVTKTGDTHLKLSDREADQVVDGPFRIHHLKDNRSVCPDKAEVVVTSPSLIEVLQRYLPHHGDLKSVAEPTVAGRDLYLVLNLLKYHVFEACDKSLSNWSEFNKDLVANGTQCVHRENDEVDLDEAGTNERVGVDHPALRSSYVKHLVRFLEEDYKDTLKVESRMRGEKSVSWDMLWAFLSKGIKVGYYCSLSGELLCAMVSAGHYLLRKSTREKSETKVYRVELQAYTYDGTRYKTCNIIRDIDEFYQEQKLLQLPVCPIEYLANLEDQSDLEKSFLANGERFCELSIEKSSRFMCYEGSMYKRSRVHEGYMTINRKKADGRVMIDLCNFAAMNPDFPMESARPPLKSNSRSCESVITSIHQDEVSSDALMFAPAIVYGFSFALKEWGCFAVSRFSDVVFDKEAFQDLVMEPRMKSLVHDLVGQYLSPDRDPVKSSEQVDPIVGKGQGCIVLCHGPPGTGKTLTAESIAESMGRPLWALSVSEFGTNSKQLEATLRQVLAIASLWKAVLLLDEADIYLERRTSTGDVVRNAMTGVFLRQLEYYRGILFLTTNRFGTIDDAFKSRISLFLRYHELGTEEMAKVWRNLLRRVDIQGVSDEICDNLASRSLNGRQIRNVIRTAQMCAKRKKQHFAIKHVDSVLRTLVDTLKELDEVSEPV